MKIPQSLDASCEELCSRWQIAPELAVRLKLMQDLWSSQFASGLRIISGYRTLEEQADLERSGRPAAPDALSTHRSCPATGADLELELTVTPSLKQHFGRAANVAGLRWGGGSPLGSDGAPIDWNHVDLGPRRS